MFPFSNKRSRNGILFEVLNGSCRVFFCNGVHLEQHPSQAKKSQTLCDMVTWPVTNLFMAGYSSTRKTWSECGPSSLKRSWRRVTSMSHSSVCGLSWAEPFFGGSHFKNLIWAISQTIYREKTGIVQCLVKPHKLLDSQIPHVWLSGFKSSLSSF